MIVGMLIAFCFVITGIVLALCDNDLGAYLSSLAGTACIIFSVLTINTSLTLENTKEKIKNPQYFTSIGLADINKTVSAIKAHPLMYWGLNTDGIDYIELDNSGYLKVDTTKD